ncbi:MAG: membrane protein insertase YidC [Acidimicrobiales bacterium]|jgi:YidC/Oxa1 family membrane protein insertase|nr:membrane protein insertase YidC [Acidimicrobiales bacterium]
MFDLIAAVLSWFYGLVPSYGFAIVMLTLVVMVIVTPLTLKGTRSMIKMQHLQPEMKKIQTRHKGDREAMNKEMMAFYQANNINPMGGCLPLLIQAPVFMVLYNVLRGMTRRLSDIGDSAGWVAGRLVGGSEAVLTGASDDLQAFYPAYVARDSDLFADLAGETEMLFLGFDLSRSASTAFSQSLGAALPYILLILIVFASSWFQQRQIRGRNPDATVNPQQQMLMKVMPFFLPVISFSLDAALVMYFVVSNLYRIAQQAYITRTLYGPGGEQAEVIVPSKAEPVKKSGQDKAGSAGGGKSAAKSAGNTQNKPSTSGSVRKGRTTAGQSSNSSQEIDDGVSNKNNSRSRSTRGRKSKSSTSTTKKKTGRRGRSAASDDSATTKKRPPAGRTGGGRTTPPGTARARSAKKKRRK